MLKLPGIWPDARLHCGASTYAEVPPSAKLLTEGTLISGLIVGAAEGTIEWIDALLKGEGPRQVCLIVVLSPACPTREEHLIDLDLLQSACAEEGKKLEIRILTVEDRADGDCRHAILPPTVIQSYDEKTGQTTLTIGSVGDAGHDAIAPGSVNFVFRPDDALRDEWRRWFEYIRRQATRLSSETVNIPHLVPATGDPEAARLWKEFANTCKTARAQTATEVRVDPKTGEVLPDPEGKDSAPWDLGKTALDPLAQVLHQVYASGHLVTVDQTTLIKPLKIPVNAKLLGCEAEHTVGTVKHKQSFALQVLDDKAEKAIEKYRKISDLVELLSYPLSKGNHWLPDTAKAILEKEIESRNEEGMAALRTALGGRSVADFVASRTQSIRADLNTMYRDLGNSGDVPDTSLKAVLDDVTKRLGAALAGRITPRAIYNRVGAPDLTAGAPDANWGQPLSLLTRSAKKLRESLTDRFFPSKFKGMSIKVADFRKSCDPFGDVFATLRDSDRADRELAELDNLIRENGPETPGAYPPQTNNTKSGSSQQAKGEPKLKNNCQKVWRLIKGLGETGKQP